MTSDYCQEGDKVAAYCIPNTERKKIADIGKGSLTDSRIDQTLTVSEGKIFHVDAIAVVSNTGSGTKPCRAIIIQFRNSV